MTKNDILGAVHGSLGILGAAVNLALLAGFTWAAYKLHGLSSAAFAAAGGMPEMTPQGLQFAVSDPALPSRAAHYVTAWLAAVGAGGCAFMAALGIRWAYHAASRLVLRLKD